MEFVHHAYIPGETIAAVATPPGEGGIAVIRISGESALAVAEKVYSGPIRSYKTHTAHFGKILNAQGELVDEVLVLVMLGKRSYTGEDTVEIHCHGGSLVTKKVLETVLQAGARAAKPGEFTFKAFMSGKIDLTQAEAVQELISAKSELALNAAEKHLSGALYQKISSFQKELVDIAANIEAWVDFPEEDLEFESLENIIKFLKGLKQKMSALSKTFHEGKIIKSGLSLCLAGAPNAGKSSLMNALLLKDRAIVTEIAGTTRDILEEDIRLGDLHFNLMDTAGIRDTEEIIEKEGIKRSKKAIHEADLILLVMDVTKDVNQELLDSMPKERTVLVWNKTDLSFEKIPELHFPYAVSVSAKEGSGLQNLKDMIHQVIWQKGPPSKEEILITNLRHFSSLNNAIDSITCLIEGLENNVSPEFLSSDMRKTLFELGSIIGTNITEDILSAIFSKFCIGK